MTSLKNEALRFLLSSSLLPVHYSQIKTFVMFSKKKRREEASVNAGSMADIAFLLLIFFLVTTTILTDEGIMVKLPPWDPTQEAIDVSGNNVLKVLINAENELLVEGEQMQVSALKDMTKDFISNPTKDPGLPERPSKAVVSLLNDRSTSYETYLSVYNELKAAYNELWEEAARRDYRKNYDALASWQQREIRKKIPLVISEAEPTDLQK